MVRGRAEDIHRESSRPHALLFFFPFHHSHLPCSSSNLRRSSCGTKVQAVYPSGISSSYSVISLNTARDTVQVTAQSATSIEGQAIHGVREKIKYREQIATQVTGLPFVSLHSGIDREKCNSRAHAMC